MLAWKTCLKRLFTVASSKGPLLAATSMSSICCSRTGSYCEAPAAVCSFPTSAASVARSESSSSSLRFRSSIRARRLRTFSGIPDTTLAETDHDHGHLEQGDQRDRDQGEVERVTGRRYDCRQRQSADDRPTAAPDQAGVGDESDACEQEAEHRHLEHQPE